MKEIQIGEFGAEARERKRKLWEKKGSLQQLIFSFQTESRAKYTKLQVFSKQVYVEEVYEEHQKSFEAMVNHVNTLHIQAREFEPNRKGSSKQTLQIHYAMSHHLEYQNEVQSVLYS